VSIGVMNMNMEYLSSSAFLFKVLTEIGSIFTGFIKLKYLNYLTRITSFIKIKPLNQIAIYFASTLQRLLHIQIFQTKRQVFNGTFQL